MIYLEIFLVTFVLSAVFALAGVGSAIALVPALNFLSVPLNWFTLPLIFSGIIFAPIGAYSSQFINEEIVKVILIFFLIVSAVLLLFYKKTPTHNKYKGKFFLFLAGGLIAYISGMLGIGGGSFLIPILIFLGYDVKKTAIAISFIIPFSTFPAFISYASFVSFDWIILCTALSSAVLGGVIGNKLMHSSMRPHYIKRLIAILLLIIAIKIGMDL